MITRENVLIYRLGSLGDTVVALPCFHLLARAFPDSTRILLTNAPVHAKAPAASAILEGSGLIHEYINYTVGTRNVMELSRLYWKIRRLRVARLIYLAPSRGEKAIRRDVNFFRACGVKEIIGAPLGDLGVYHYDDTTDRYESEARRLARCIARIGDARLNDPASWDLLLTENEQACAARALQPLNGTPFLALGIACKKSVADWGIENWKALMFQLRRKFPEHALVFIGAKEDRAAADEVGGCWAGKSLNLSGTLSPRQSAAVLRWADLFLGLDSGPMHLAASVGVSCVAIFAANSYPGIWFPFGDTHEVIYHKTSCFGCRLEVCSIEKKRCILSISSDEVIAAAVRAVQRRQPAVIVPTVR